MRFVIGLLAVLILVMGVNIPPANAVSSVEQSVPEFVISKPSKEYCEFVIQLSPSAADVAESRLFDFMESANAYTKGWRATFAVVDVNYDTNTTFSLISFTGCPAATIALNFVTRFFDRWQKLHCSGKCELWLPHITSRAKLDFTIPYEGYKFKSQIDEFLHYRQKDALKSCTIEIDLMPAMAVDFAHTDLFGAVMELQRKFRYPILDISQIDGKLYVLLSRQCLDKETLYARMIWNLKHRGFDVGTLRTVNFRPDVSDYLFSQTGQR
ncbi:MAG TPA: hypothetical protein VNU97_07140 [Rhizomicrobium sp.]|jgi:hypothetical protein|nr:hypothetical protein [Rhizomicrobium sp.]